MGIIIPGRKVNGIDAHYIGPVWVDVIVEQIHQSRLSITRNPVEFGADVTDHAYVEPKRVGMHIITSLGAARAFTTYNNIIAVQETRLPFELVTGLKHYKNLLIENITATRSHETGQILDAQVDMLEIIWSTGMAYSVFKPVPRGQPKKGGPADKRGEDVEDKGPQQTEEEDVKESLMFEGGETIIESWSR